MRRRDFLGVLGSATAWPLAAGAQQRPVIGYFNSGTLSTQVKNGAAFRKGLKETGLIEGQNVAIEFVWAENRFERLQVLAAEVVARRPNMMVATRWRRFAPRRRRRRFQLCSRQATIRFEKGW